jgi:hypothetical protein
MRREGKIMGSSTRVGRSALGRLGSLATVVAAGAVIVMAASPAIASAATGVTGYTIVQGASTAITPGETVSGSATCPSGKVVVSGGISAHSPLTFVSASWPSSSNAWTVIATDTGIETSAEHFTAYAVCVDQSSVPGIHIAESGPPFNVGDVGQAYAFCAAGEVPVGGGEHTSDGATLMTISQPALGPPYWFASVLYTGSPASFNTYAVCIPSTDVSSYTIGSASYGGYGTFLGLLGSPPGAALTAVPPAVTNTAGAPYCGSGQLAVGGGAFSHDWQNGGRISSIYPDSSGKYWLATATDVAPPEYYNEYFLPGDICITGSMVEPTSLTAAPQLVEFLPFAGIGSQVVQATLTSGGSPVSGVTISFSVGSTPLCTATTGLNGVARCFISPSGQARVNQANSYTATFAGNGDYLASHATTPEVVLF